MEAQVENAIQIAYDPRADQSLKAQALDFIAQLRNEQQGWSVCLPLAVRQPRASEVVRLVALDTVNTAVQGRLETQELLYVRDHLLQYVRSTYGSGSTEEDPSIIENKIAQTYTYLFTSLYGSHWQSFFDDLLALTYSTDASVRNNIAGTRFYLKVVASIHDEIGDTIISRSREEQQRDNDLKDLVRDRDITKVTTSWKDILLQFQSQDSGIIEQCLSVIGRWAVWTDLALIVDDQLLSLMYGLVSSGLSASDDTAARMRDVSLSTFMEILGKKMKPADKLQLIEVLKISGIVSQLTTSPSLQQLRFTPEYDTDLAEMVARLVNNTINDIVMILDSASPSDPSVPSANTQLKIFLPYALRFFSDEYDEICSSVIPCITDVLTLFRRKNSPDSDYDSLLPSILQAIIQKMKYDETTEWGNEDALTDEAEFSELRKKLQVLQQAVAAVNESLYIDTISGVVASSFETFQANKGHMDWRDLDLALHEMFLFGQLAQKGGSLFSKSKPISPAAERLVAMMAKLVEVDVAAFPHPAIHLQYMEICVRYYSFFENHPQAIPPVLNRFIQFVHNDNVKVRTRSWYLFYRFVKLLRHHIGDISQTALQAVSDLLPIKAELPEDDPDTDDMSSNEDDQSADAKFTSQLYLYEALGNIFSVPAVQVESQVFYTRTVMDPLFTDLQAHLGPAQSGDERAILQVHHLIMALGTLAHGFSEWIPAAKPTTGASPAKEVSIEFGRAAEAILVALESLNNSLEVRTAARSAFSRLVGVLGSGILEHLPRWIDGLLSRASSKDEMATFLRLLDQVVFSFKNEIESILNSLLTPFLQRVFAGMAEPANGTDDEIQLTELKQQYLGFLLVILNNDLGRVFVSDENQPVFENLVSTLEHFAKDSRDLQTAKLSFTTMTKMIIVWGGPDIIASKAATLTDATAQPSLPGFDRYMIERFSPLCWSLAGSNSFDFKDAQARNALGEAAAMKKTILIKTGQQYVDYLRSTELPGTGMDTTVSEEFIKAICELEVKQFRTYFQNLLSRSGR